jgi:cytochrome c oxidase cbb3-type subunit III
MIRGGAALGVVLLAGLAGCEREQRRFTEASPASGVPRSVSASQLYPGTTRPPGPVRGAYGENAWAISEGKRYYEWFNCVGCHSHGGGGMGPALMDDRWIYGSEPDQIFATIVQGRPNGMPSFQGRIPNQQIWQIVAYVRSLSGLTPKDARGSRDDHMYVKPPEMNMPHQQPRREGTTP